jgi:hypothetical protein
LETDGEPVSRKNAHLNPRRVMTRSLIGLNILMMVGFFVFQKKRMFDLRMNEWLWDGITVAWPSSSSL